VVRGPAALLGALALALTYFLAADALPDLGTGDTAVLASGIAGVVMVSLVVLTLVWAADSSPAVVLVLLGGALLVGAMDAAGAGPEASAFEALTAGAVGILLARMLAVPAVALAVPLFVAAVDTWSVVTGPSSRLLHGEPRGTAELTFDLPSWGGSLGDAATRLGLTDAIFLAMFAAWSVRFGLRPKATALGMVLGLVATVVISVVTDRAIPALPLLAVGYWVPNIDRLPNLFKG